MTPETAKLVAQAQQFLSLGFTSANSRDPNCIALLNCVQDKGNAGRLSLLPSGLSFESEGGVLSVHTHEVLHVALQETNYGDVDVPVRIPKPATGEGNSELVRMQRLLVDSRDASRLLGSAGLSDVPRAPSARSEEPVDDTFQLLDKRVIVVQRLVLDGSAHSALLPALSELRFVAPNPDDALEFSLLACNHIKAYWAHRLLPDVRKASGDGGDSIIMIAPVVALHHAQSGFFGAKSDDSGAELALVCLCSRGIAVAHVTASAKAEHGYTIDRWKYVQYSKLSDIVLSCDDALQFSLAFAKGSAWEPYAVYCSSPALRAELCYTLQRVYSKCCSEKHLAPNLFADKFYPASCGEMRLLTQASAEQWLARTGLTCLKFGRQGEPQVRTIKFNAADCSLFWNSDSKKKDPLLLSQVMRARFAVASVCAQVTAAQVQNFNIGQRSPLFDKFQPKCARLLAGVLRHR
jgi:hypothetical protein